MLGRVSASWEGRFVPARGLSGSIQLCSWANEVDASCQAFRTRAPNACHVHKTERCIPPLRLFFKAPQCQLPHTWLHPVPVFLPKPYNLHVIQYICGNVLCSYGVSMPTLCPCSYEFTTLTCIPGVIHYNDSKIQLLDLPGETSLLDLPGETSLLQNCTWFWAQRAFV